MHVNNLVFVLFLFFHYRAKVYMICMVQVAKENSRIFFVVIRNLVCVQIIDGPVNMRCRLTVAVYHYTFFVSIFSGVFGFDMASV